MPLPPEVAERVAPFVSSLTDDVFALSGLPEEVIAVLFAYYSRSRDDLRTNLAKLLGDAELGVAGTGAPVALGMAEEKARAFHEKWVVGYGHASVAEHAVVHLAVENASILASKAIEDLRLGSFTEKSTRYVVFDQQSFVVPPDLPAEHAARIRATNQRLFGAYLALVPRAIEALGQRLPRPEGASEAAHQGALRSHACDLLRGLLPAGTKTNLGLTANARAVEILLSKLYGSPLAEVRDLAASMHRAASTVAPTLVKYARPSEYRSRMPDRVADAIKTVYTPPEGGLRTTSVIAQPVRLVRHDKDALERIVLALAYDGTTGKTHAHGILDALRYASTAELEAVVNASLEKRGPWDPLPRAFEASTITFELMLDYGAYRDLQRHRMLTPAPQILGCHLAFEPPAELAELGLLEPYVEAMVSAHEAWFEVSKTHPNEAQYLVPLGYRVRVLWTLNLRELGHVVELRSAKQGHTTYRRIAQGLYRMACGAHPWLKSILRVDLQDYPLARA